jgi:hypothetical protein
MYRTLCVVNVRLFTAKDYIYIIVVTPLQRYDSLTDNLHLYNSTSKIIRLHQIALTWEKVISTMVLVREQQHSTPFSHSLYRLLLHTRSGIVLAPKRRYCFIQVIISLSNTKRKCGGEKIIIAYVLSIEASKNDDANNIWGLYCYI